MVQYTGYVNGFLSILYGSDRTMPDSIKSKGSDWSVY